LSYSAEGKEIETSKFILKYKIFHFPKYISSVFGKEMKKV